MLYSAGPATDEYSFWLDAGPDATSGWSWLGSGSPAAAPRDLGCHAGPMPADGGGLNDGFRGGWVGWLGYDDAARHAGAPALDDPLLPQEAGMHVDRFVAADHAARRMWAYAPADTIDDYVAEVQRWCVPPQAPITGVSREVRARHTPDAYRDLIEKCRAAIREGEAYQLCLTTRFEVAGEVDPLSTYLRLRAATPAHHGGIIRVGPSSLLSASPERFVEIADGVVRTRPIKGTRPRGSNDSDDAAQIDELRTSVKEQAENVMIVDLMRNDLQRVCQPGTVATERLLEVESYPAVHQLVSTVAGRLRPGIRIGDVLTAAFPAASMTGAPKLAAMTILNGLEAAPRGIFSGCFGWIGDDGRADLAMVIRSIAVHPGGAYVGAGGGITWLSDAAAEREEVSLKARGPLAALGGRLPSGW